MSLELLDDGGLKFVVHRLAAEVLVEGTSPAAEGILLVLVVVGFKVAYQAAAHVRVVLAGTEGREKLRTSLLVQVGAETPAGNEDDEEVEPDEGDSLLGLLDEGRVHVHMVLGGEVVIKNSVDIFKVSDAGVVVRLAELRIGFMEVAAASPNGKGRLDGHGGASTHRLREHEEVRIDAHI